MTRNAFWGTQKVGTRFTPFHYSHVTTLFTSYADDTSFYAYWEDIDLLIEEPEIKASKICKWFNKNVMKANADKCHVALTTKKDKTVLLAKKQCETVKRKIYLQL